MPKVAERAGHAAMMAALRDPGVASLIVNIAELVSNINGLVSEGRQLVAKLDGKLDFLDNLDTLKNIATDGVNLHVEADAKITPQTKGAMT